MREVANTQFMARRKKEVTICTQAVALLKIQSEAHQRDHNERTTSRSFADVLERIGDRPVAVEAEDEEVEYRRGARRVVDGDPELAQSDAEDPVLREDVDCADRHYEQADYDVGDS